MSDLRLDEHCGAWLIKRVIWFVSGAIFLVGLLAWKFLPVCKLYGKPVMLRGLFDANTRLLLKLERAETALNVCLRLPPGDRLPALLETEKRFGDTFIMGDKIRTAIIATGEDGAAVHLSRILHEGHGQISVTGGIRDALKTGTIGGDYRVQAFKFLVEGLDHSDRFGVSQRELPGLLLDLDEEWALRILRSTEYFHPGHPIFREVLSGFNERNLLVDLTWITSWLPKFQGRELHFSEGLTYIEILNALLSHDAPRAVSLLEDAMRDQREIAVHAAEALVIARNLPLPCGGLSDLKQLIGFDALTPAEKTVWLAGVYDSNLNYGLEQFEAHDYCNEHIMEMRRALLEVGAPNDAAMLSEYIALYGSGGVPKEHDERIKVINSHDSWYEQVEVIKKQHENREDVALLTLCYELAHVDTIRKQSEIKRMLSV